MTPLAAIAQDLASGLSVAMVCPADMQLYPLRIMDRDPQSLLNLVYEGLVILDDNRRPIPLLAESWQEVGDGADWVFTLRQDVRFHDGRPLTADDVIATLDAIKALADEGLGPYQQTVQYISRWQADDEHTVRVRATHSSYLALYAMTFPVLPRSAVNSECPPGTGPYSIVYYQAGNQLLLSGNQNWWKRPPSIHTITGIYYKNTNEALNAFQLEATDVLMTRSLSATRYRGVIGSTVNSFDYHTQQLECVVFNHYVSKLRNVEMRRAIAHAIDKSRLITAVYQSVATTTEGLAMPGTYLYNSALFNTANRSHAYSPESANRLLNELGYDQYNAEGYRFRMHNGEEDVLSLRLYYYDEPGSSLRKDVAGLMREMLAAVGIQLRLSVMNLEGVQAKMKSGDYDLILAGYNFGTVPDPSFLLASDGAENKFRYSSESMKKLLQQLRRAHKEEDFQAAWLAIQEQFADELPLVPLYWRNGLLLMRGIYLSERDIREYQLLRGLPEYGH